MKAQLIALLDLREVIHHKYNDDDIDDKLLEIAYNICREYNKLPIIKAIDFKIDVINMDRKE